MRPRLCFSVALIGLFASANLGYGQDRIEFNRHIRPILSEHCFVCHGPDKGRRKAKLRLDDRANAIEKGIIVPGKPDESELVLRIEGAMDRKVMPPEEAHKPLNARQKELLRQWIAQGAEYQPHWAYIPPKRPVVPSPGNLDWVRNPIDAFTLTALESRRIAPSPQADPRRLVRRLYLDLIGIPPSIEEVDSFLADKAPKAYERLVEKLLASPHYGERMSVPWLDLVRYADSVGYHGDQNQNIFPYRDYIIESFSKNKRFDAFTREQLAGDLLPQATTESRIASGFNRLNMMTREGGAQPKEYLAKYQADRVRTVSVTWLGSTMGCCECHDHKYDPFTSRDFYAMSAFFADIRQWGVYQDYTYTPNPDLKGWSNDHPFPPEIEVESAYLHQRQARLREEMESLAESFLDDFSQSAAHRNRLESWVKEARSFVTNHPDGWTILKSAMASKDGAEPEPDGSFLLTTTAKKGDAHSLTLRLPKGGVTALRIEALPHARNKGKIVRGNAASTNVQVSAHLKGSAGDKRTKLEFAYADANIKDPRYFNGEELQGILGGWKTAAKQVRVAQTAVYVLAQPAIAAEGDLVTVDIRSDAIGCIRVSASPLPIFDPKQASPWPGLAEALDSPQEARSLRQWRKLSLAYLMASAWDRQSFRQNQDRLIEILACRDGKAFTQVSAAQAPFEVRVLPRGNFLDETGPIVQPAVPHFLPQPKAAGQKRLNRLDLADWILADDNPLTARVFVNRLWKQLLGAGLSGVMEDLGGQGEWPTHPELLDWLAVEFRESGWDVKHMVRLIVQSATYRQDSRARPELRDIDPGNRLLAYHTPRRLDAEFVRDNALAIAGLLNRDVGGPPARPYQPAGYYAALQFPDRDYTPHRDDRQYRRGVYMHWQRTFLHPMLANFDAPAREECAASRNLANTPQQALTLLNDPTFVEAARVLAEQALRQAKSDDSSRLDYLMQRALARPSQVREREPLLRLLAQQREKLRAEPAEAKKILSIGLAPASPNLPAEEVAAWTTVCRVLLNLQETITRY